MTDEERRKLAELHAIGDCDISVDSTTHDLCKWAADEIERLAAELKQVESENEHHIRLAFVDAGANPARTWKEEAERLAALAQFDAEPDPNFDPVEAAEVDAKSIEAANAQSDAEPDSKLEELVSRWEALKDGGGPSASQDVLEEELLTIISLARKGLTARAADRSRK